jgi:hypothetical protein
MGTISLLIRWRVVRISNSSDYFECVKKVANELEVGRNEMKGIDEVWLVVAVVLEMVYDSKVCNKNCAKSKCGKKVEERIEHRVANPKSKAEGRKAEEEGGKLLS